MDSFSPVNRSYRWPLLVAAAAILAVLLWGWGVSENDRRLAEEEQRLTARHLTKAIQGTILSQVSRGCVDAERVQTILSSIREETGLASLSLSVDGKPFLDMPGQASLPAAVQGDEGQVRIGGVFYSWQPLHLEPGVSRGRGAGMKGGGGGMMGGGSMMGGGGGGGGGCIWRDQAGQTQPLQSLKMILVLGLPTEELDARLAAARSRLLLSMLSGVLAIILLTAAWVLNAGRQDLRSRLVRLESEKSRLEELQLVAAGVAHETKNPLGIIRGLAQRIEQEGDVPAGVQEMAAKIVDEADVTSERLADFLNFARLREPKLQVVEAQATLERITTLLQGDFATAGVALKLECPEVKLQADPDLLSQIVVNLLMNSLAACGTGGEVKVVVAASGSTATLRVEDNGCGMAPELLQDIFKPYVSGRPEGHGIGLSIVRRLAEAMGWRVQVQSEAGRGTVMTLQGLQVQG